MTSASGTARYLGRPPPPPRQRRPAPSCPWPDHRPARPPARRGRSRQPPPARTAVLDRAGAAPNAAGATSPTRSGRTRSKVCAAGPARSYRPWRSERPARVQPHRQRRARSLEDRARGHRRAARAPGAFPPAVRQLPTVDVPALIADETVRPAQPRQVVPAVRVRAEPRQELAHRPWISLARLGAQPRSKSTPVKWRALSTLTSSVGHGFRPRGRSRPRPARPRRQPTSRSPFPTPRAGRSHHRPSQACRLIVGCSSRPSLIICRDGLTHSLRQMRALWAWCPSSRSWTRSPPTRLF